MLNIRSWRQRWCSSMPSLAKSKSWLAMILLPSPAVHFRRACGIGCCVVRVIKSVFFFFVVTEGAPLVQCEYRHHHPRIFRATHRHTCEKDTTIKDLVSCVISTSVKICGVERIKKMWKTGVYIYSRDGPVRARHLGLQVRMGESRTSPFETKLQAKNS